MGIGPGAIGDPCTGDAQCASGQCLTAAQDKRFVDGYCTVKHCTTAPDSCPTGSACKGTGLNDVPVCLKDCASGTVCRTSYECCTGRPLGGGPGWCAPQSLPLCLVL